MRGVSNASSGNRSTRLASRLRDLADRIARLERKKTYTVQAVTIGAWKLTTNSAGQLIATNTQTGQTRTLAP